MKKYFLIAAFALIALPAGLAHADGEACSTTTPCPSTLETCDSTNFCASVDLSCNGACTSGTACSAGTCVSTSGSGATQQATCGSSGLVCPSTASCSGGTSGQCIDNTTGNVVPGVAPGSAGAAGTPGSTNGTGFQPLAPIPGLDDTTANNVTATSLASFLQNLYKYLIGVAAIIAIIQIIRGGIEYATVDNVGKKTDGKRHIQQALFGLVLVLSPALVFTIINPAIINLSLNLPPLNTPQGTSTLGTAPTTTTDPATGCTVTGTYFEQATCPTQAAAQAFVSACTSAVPGGTVSGSVLPCQSTSSSGTCTDPSYSATCSTQSAPHAFLDVAQAGWSLTGIINWVVDYADYEPTATSPLDPNNGVDVQQFASKCLASSGEVCLYMTSASASTCPYTSEPASQANDCYESVMTCQTTSLSVLQSLGITARCGSSPSFTIIN